MLAKKETKFKRIILKVYSFFKLFKLISRERLCKLNVLILPTHKKY